MREETRNRIILFSFVLTVFVIWLHAGESLISSIPGQIAVPGFFILSGFLFYYGIPGPAAAPAEGDAAPAEGNAVPAEGTAAYDESVSAPGESTAVPVKRTSASGGLHSFFPDWMGRKLLRRLKTLLIPYLVWNAVYYAVYLIAGKTDITEFPAAILHYSCNPVFWYLFQLNLITAVAPLLYFIMKRKVTAVIWMAVIFTAAVFYGTVHSLVPVSFINEDALFYYCAGAFLAMYVVKPENGTAGSAGIKKAVPEEAAALKEAAAAEEKAVTEGNASGETKKMIFAAAGICAGTLIVFTAARYILPGELINIGVIGQRLSGALLVWFLTGFFRKIRILPWMKITFFIYATHYLVIRAVWAAEIALGLNGNAAANIATYLIMPAVCIAAAYGLYILMKKLVPKVLGFLTGGRGN